MKLLICNIIVFFSLVACGVSGNEPTPRLNDFEPIDPASFSSIYVVKNVQLVTMISESITAAQDIKIENGVITEIGEIDVSELPDSIIIDGAGKFLMPGLNDMHIHQVNNNPHILNDLFLYLAQGVTSVRVMWGFTSFLTTKEQINDRQAFGPKMYVASPGLEGTSALRGGLVFNNASETRQAVNVVIDAGFDFVKTYQNIPSNLYPVLLEEAAARNVKVIGHLSTPIDPYQAFRSGNHSFEHLMSFRKLATSTGSFFSGDLDMRVVKNLADSIALHDVYLCPTVMVETNNASKASMNQQHNLYKSISGNLKTFLEVTSPGNLDASKSEESFATIIEVLNNTNQDYLLSGVDSGFGHLIPGLSLQDELEFYVERAGLTPFEALKTSTINSARFYDNEGETGTIEIGKRGDLVLLNENPLADIENIRKIDGVFVNGMWVSRNFIDQRLSEIAKLYGNN